MVWRGGWIAATAALVFVASLTPVSDADLWWHLAAGREMVATRGFLRVDPFTLSAAGRPWIDLHWLFQLWAYVVHQAGGLRALVVAKAVVVAAAAVGLGAVVRTGLAASTDPDDQAVRAAGPLLAVVLGGAAFAARHLILLRPVLFTLAFLALFLWLLEAHARPGDRAPRGPRLGRAGQLWALPALQVVWVNCQGLFALGPALVGAYALGQAIETRSWRDTRPLLIALVACCAACFVTPYGIAGVLLPVELLARVTPGGQNVFSENIAENVPPWLLARTTPGQFAHLSVALVVVALGVVAAWRRLRVARLLVLGGFAALALAANRNVLLFYWVAAPITVINLAPAWARGWTRLRAAVADHRSAAVRAGVAAAQTLPLGLAAAAIGVLAVIAATRETSIAAPAPFRVPSGAVAWLQDHPPRADRPGRIFAADHHGGYVTWMLWPRHRVYIDTRLVLHTADEYSDFLGLLHHPRRFDEFARRQDFDHALLPTVYPDRYVALIQHLLRSPGWRLVFTDGTETLFARTDRTAGIAADTALPAAVDLSDAGVVATVAAQIDARHAAADARAAAHRHLAWLLLIAGHADRAHDVLAAWLLRHPTDGDARALLARTFWLQGQVAAAQTTARAVLRDHGDRPAVLDLLAQIAVDGGDRATALVWLRRSLTADPRGGEARRLLAQIQRPPAPLPAVLDGGSPQP